MYMNIEKAIIEDFVNTYEYLRANVNKYDRERLEVEYKRTYEYLGDALCTLTLDNMNRGLTDARGQYNVFYVSCMSELTGEVMTYIVEQNDDGIDVYKKLV